jgi:CRP/FNR family transcriptional regulator, nitrogen oxide reductase regulator
MFEPATARLLRGLGQEEIRLILGAATARRFKTSEIIVRVDEPATRLFLVRIGCVDYYVVTKEGREILLRRLVPRDVFGVGAFLSEPIGYLGTAKAVTESEVLIWEHRATRQLAKTYPRLAENALRTVLHYAALFAQRHIRLVSKTAQERVAWALTTVGSRSGRVLPTGVEVDIKNEELASLADVSFFTASRVLKDWERQGAVEKSRGKVLIRCPEKLVV